MDNAPGGGSSLTLTDPEGFPMVLIYGQEPRDPDQYPQKLELNDESEKLRRRRFIRLTPGPAEVYKVCELLRRSRTRLSGKLTSVAWTLRTLRSELPRATRFLYAPL